MSSNNLEMTGKFLGAKALKTLDNGKNVGSFFLDITDNPDYPSTPEFGLYGDKCSEIDGLQKGDEITVKFNLKGTKYTNKTTGKSGVFTALQCWKIEKAGAAERIAESQSAPMPIENQSPDAPDDDLPF